MEHMGKEWWNTQEGNDGAHVQEWWNIWVRTDGVHLQEVMEHL